MNLVFSSQEADFDRWLEDVERRIEEAKTGAVKDAAALAMAEGRANIAAAGFATRWLKSKFFSNKSTGDPAAIVFDAMPFAAVFEKGATIGGRPLLWLPIGDKAGVRSPRQYGGKLVSVNVRGKPPLLFAADDRARGPLFVGVPTATIRKRLDLRSIFKLAAEKVKDFYEERMKS